MIPRGPKRKILLDVDTGHDDAAAILMAAHNPSFDILGITVTAGNQTLPKTLQNTLNVCSLLGLDVPIFPGMTRPLLGELRTAERIHGDSGLDGPVFPPCGLVAQDVHGAVHIANTIRQSERGSLTLVATGPLSNIAMAARLAPEIGDLVSELVLMGGSAGNGNVTPSAEFNIHADPEAAAIVFSSFPRIVMFGLDVTRQVVLTDELFDRFSRIPGKGSDLFKASMTHYIKSCKTYIGESPAMHDPCCIAYLENPHMFRFEEAHVGIETQGSLTRGRTVVDFSGLGGMKRNCKVALSVNPGAFWESLEAALRRNA